MKNLLEIIRQNPEKLSTQQRRELVQWVLADKEFFMKIVSGSDIAVKRELASTINGFGVSSDQILPLLKSFLAHRKPELLEFYEEARKLESKIFALENEVFKC